MFTGDDNLNHEVRFRFAGSGTPGDPYVDQIYDIQNISTTGNDDCEVVGGDHIECPGSDTVRVELGGGNDSVDLTTDCFGSYSINLGNGENRNLLNAACDCGKRDDQRWLRRRRIGRGRTRHDDDHQRRRGRRHGEYLFVPRGRRRDIIHGGEGEDLLRG